MGIYIKGMEMPKRDSYFLLTPNGNIYDADTGLTLTQFTAIPVPDHGRLIDADALIEKFPDNGWGYHDYICAEIRDEIRRAQTIIPADHSSDAGEKEET